MGRMPGSTCRCLRTNATASVLDWSVAGCRMSACGNPCCWRIADSDQFDQRCALPWPASDGIGSRDAMPDWDMTNQSQPDDQRTVWCTCNGRRRSHRGGVGLCPCAAQRVMCDEGVQILGQSGLRPRVSMVAEAAFRWDTWPHAVEFPIHPNKMFDYCCKNFSRFVAIDQSYPLYEWTISIFKKEYMQEKYPQPELIKYLK